MYNSTFSRFIGWLCSFIVIFNAFSIFVNVIYPIIHASVHLGVSLANFKFGIVIFIRSFSAYTLLVLGIALPGRSRAILIITFFILLIIFISGIWLGHPVYNSIAQGVGLIMLGVAYPYFTRQFYLSYTQVQIF